MVRALEIERTDAFFSVRRPGAGGKSRLDDALLITN
jgi:hypothetical protein